VKDLLGKDPDQYVSISMDGSAFDSN